MNSNAKVAEGPIRLVFELARADHPRLYDDLVQFPKGTKRINRLRVLAYDGLLVQGGHIVLGGPTNLVGGAQGGGGELDGEITNDLFGPSVAE
jgi:hypothetical protein